MWRSQADKCATSSCRQTFNSLVQDELGTCVHMLAHGAQHARLTVSGSCMANDILSHGDPAKTGSKRRVCTYLYGEVSRMHCNLQVHAWQGLQETALRRTRPVYCGCQRA